MPAPPPLLTDDSLRRVAGILAKGDSDLARILKRIGPPPLWDREPGFPTLVHIILEQQVSLASARAAFDKLSDTVSPLEPQKFLTLDDATLTSVGFSGQKGRYCRELAHALIDGALDLDVLPSLADHDVRAELAARAALEGKSMQEYLRGELVRLAARPSRQDWLRKVRDRKRAADTRIPPELILEQRDADRR